MPQFDTTFFTAEVFWTIVSFGMLFMILAKWILPRIASILTQRAQLIEEEVSAAYQRHDEADDLKREYANKLINIEQEIQVMFNESEKRVFERRKQLMDEWKLEMERKRKVLIEDIGEMRRQAVRDVRVQSADLIVLATEQLIHQKVSDIDAQKILEEAISELKEVNFKQH